MGRADTCQQTIGRPKVAAVHPDVANPARGVLGDEGTGDTGVTAEARLLHRRREHRQTDLLQLRTNVNLFVYGTRSEEHTSELQSLRHLVCRLLLEKNKTKRSYTTT